MTEIVPSCVNYVGKPQTSYKSKSRRKETTYLYPTQSGGVSSNNSNKVIKFMIGNQGLLDPINTYLRFDAQFSITNPIAVDDERIYASSNTETWIKRLTILTANGSRVVEDIQNYSVLSKAKSITIGEDYRQSLGRQCLNASADADTKYCLAVQERQYIIEFSSSGLLSGDSNNRRPYIPLSLIAGNNSNSFIVEIEFEDVDELCTVNNIVNVDDPTGNPNYTFSNIVMVQELLHDPEIEEGLKQSVKDGAVINYHVDTYSHYSNRLLENSTRASYVVSEFQESIRDFTCVFRDEEFINNKKEEAFSIDNPNLKSVQLKIGNEYHPAQPIKCDNNKYAELYYEMSKAHNKNRRYADGLKEIFYADVVVGGSTDPNNPTTTVYEDGEDFVVSINLRQFDDDCGKQPTDDFFSGVNTQSNPSVINLNIECDTQASNYVIDSFVHYDRLIVISKDGLDMM